MTDAASGRCRVGAPRDRRRGSAPRAASRARWAGVLVGLLLVGPAAPSVPAAAQTAAATPATTDFRPALLPPPGWPEPPDVSASSYLLVDADTGQVLAARSPDNLRPVASTVKLLTALTALPKVDLDERVRVGPEVTGLEGALVGLEPGEVWTVRQLLEAVLVRSGNDATRALAVAAAGSVDAFVADMRATARDLGLGEATIASPSGLRDENLLSARHLAVLARVTLTSPTLLEVAGLPAVTLPDVGAEPNRNLLLERYPGAVGLKTGYTSAAGWCVVGAARRDGRTLVAVVLDAAGADRRFADAARLFDHGFGLTADGEVFRRAVKVAGGAVVERAAVPGLLAPDGEVTARAPVRVAVPNAGRWVDVTWADAPVGSVRTVVEPPAARPRGVGAALVDAAYEGLRAAVVHGVWDEQGSASLADGSGGAP